MFCVLQEFGSLQNKLHPQSTDIIQLMQYGAKCLNALFIKTCVSIKILGSLGSSLCCCAPFVIHTHHLPYPSGVTCNKRYNLKAFFSCTSKSFLQLSEILLIRSKHAEMHKSLLLNFRIAYAWRTADVVISFL